MGLLTHYFKEDPRIIIAFTYAMVLELWVLALFSSQLFFVSLGLTTNEFINRNRLAYLWRDDRKSMLRNALSKGFCANISNFLSKNNKEDHQK